MRNHYKKILNTLFRQRLFRSRADLNVTQEEMAERLAMACRTYVDPEHGKTSCSALTFVLYLIFVCSNPTDFLEELRNAFENDSSEAA